MANKPKTRSSYQESLIQDLKKDPQAQVEYLKACLEENDLPEVFLKALRDVAEARGIKDLAEKSELNRENLYKMLSSKGNPELRSLYKILDVLGLKLSVESKGKAS